MRISRLLIRVLLGFVILFITYILFPSIPKALVNTLNVYKLEERLNYYNDRLLDGNLKSKELENATFVTLARNADLYDLIETINIYENRFNSKHNYPWVFLNDEPFTRTFEVVMSRLTSGPTYFGVVNSSEWDIPKWIDMDIAHSNWNRLSREGVLYGGMKSYRQMCRYFSGFFWRHPLLDPYKYYWRVEPSTKLLCEVNKDPFRQLRLLNKTYGFVITLFEIGQTVPSLWNSTLEFIEKYPETLAKNNLWEWISDDNGKKFSHCHFVSEASNNISIY